MYLKQVKNIVIFTNGNLFSRIILDQFIKKHHSKISYVVLIAGDYHGEHGLKALIKYFKTTALRFVFFKIWTLLVIKILKIFNNNIIPDVYGLCIKYDIRYIKVNNINEPDLFEKISVSKPQYLISVSCPQLIKEKWLNLFNYRGINIHSSLLPTYAGLAPYFWVLSNGEKSTGITVHYLIKGFDKGNILGQSKLDIRNNISSFELFFKLSVLGTSLLCESFEKLIAKFVGEQQLSSSKSYYSNPTPISIKNLKKNGYYLYKSGDLHKIKNYLVSINNI